VRFGPVWNLFKEDTVPEYILGINGVVLEAGMWTVLADDGTSVESFNEDTVSECSLGIKGEV